MSIEIRTAGLEDFLAEDDPLRILLLGVSSSGKTPWAAQAPAPLVMAVDKSAPASLAMTSTPHAVVKSQDEAVEFLDWYIREQKRPSFEYKTLVIDTLSQLQNRHAQAIMARGNKGSLRDVEGGWDLLKAGTSAILERVAKIETNVIVLVHLKDKFDTPEYEPDLIGSAKWDVPKDFPFIGHLRVDWTTSEPTEKGKPASTAGTRVIDWRPSIKFPILRSPGGLLDQTVARFNAQDWEQLRSGLSGGIQSLEIAQSASVATVEVVAQETLAAPPDVEGGPVEPKVAAPRKTAAKKAAAKPEGPKSTPEAEAAYAKAVEEVQEKLGGTIVAETDLASVISVAQSADELKKLWADNQNVWSDELTSKSKERIAELASKEGN